MNGWVLAYKFYTKDIKLNEYAIFMLVFKLTPFDLTQWADNFDLVEWKNRIKNTELWPFKVHAKVASWPIMGE